MKQAHLLRPRLSALLFVLTLFSSHACSQSNFFEPLDVQVDSNDEQQLGLLGWLVEEVSYGLQDPGAGFARTEAGINKIETRLYLQFDKEIGNGWGFRLSGNFFHDEVYRLVDEPDYSRAEVSEHRNRYQIRDFYLEHETESDLYFKIGNQIIAWGQAEYLRVTDLINIENRYTLGQQDLEDLRLQVPALLSSYPLGDWQLQGVVTVRAGMHQLAPERDEFDPFIGLRQSGVRPEILDSDKEHEVFLRLARQSSAGDLQFIAGEFNDNMPTGIGVRPGILAPVMRFQQQRVRAAGLSANRVSGPWLAFAEAGLHKGRTLQPAIGTLAAISNSWESRDQWLGAIGLEYSGVENLLLSVEIDTIHTRQDTAGLMVDRNQTGYGARFLWTALNERLQILGVWNELPDATGQVTRLSASYDWSDAISLGALWVNYRSQTASIYSLYRHNDVLQLQLRFNFQY